MKRKEDVKGREDVRGQGEGGGLDGAFPVELPWKEQ